MTKQHGEKVALVTGGSSGIGRVTAIAFAGEGANVVVADINVEGGQETVSLIRQTGGEASFIKADVSQAADVEAMVQGTLDAYGRLDFGINNAGIEGSWARTAEYNLDEWDRVLGINLTGVFYCMHHQIPVMLEQGGGVIVNVASIAGLRGLANSSAYSASKHGVIGLTKAAALEYARQQIRINAVCPVFTRTPMLEAMLSIDESYEERLKRNIPMRRFGTPEDVAAAILWLCSDTAGFVTGHSLPLDGGIMAG